MFSSVLFEHYKFFQINAITTDHFDHINRFVHLFLFKLSTNFLNTPRTFPVCFLTNQPFNHCFFPSILIRNMITIPSISLYFP